MKATSASKKKKKKKKVLIRDESSDEESEEQEERIVRKPRGQKRKYKRVEEQKDDEELKADEEQKGDDQAGDKQVVGSLFQQHKKRRPICFNPPPVILSLPTMSVQANVINEVTNFMPKFLPQVVKEALKKTPSSLGQSSSKVYPLIKQLIPLSEYELKKILYKKMHKSQSHLTNYTHQDLYDALTWSMLLDKATMKGGDNPDKILKKRDRGDDQDEDPSAGPNQGMKKIRIGKDAEPSKKTSHHHESSNVKSSARKILKKDWFKKAPRPETLDLDRNTFKTIDDTLEQSWFNEMVQAKKPPLTFDELMSTPNYFSAFAMNRLKLNKITREVLVVILFNLLKVKDQTPPNYDLSDNNEEKSKKKKLMRVDVSNHNLLIWTEKDKKTTQASWESIMMMTVQKTISQKLRSAVGEGKHKGQTTVARTTRVFVGIKRLLDDLRVTADKVCVTTASIKVNAAGTKLQLLKRLRLLEDFILSEKG
ncbi:hypothetical protein Tco_0348780 [Tanacetum coccineum]